MMMMTSGISGWMGLENLENGTACPSEIRDGPKVCLLFFMV